MEDRLLRLEILQILLRGVLEILLRVLEIILLHVEGPPPLPLFEILPGLEPFLLKVREISSSA